MMHANRRAAAAWILGGLLSLCAAPPASAQGAISADTAYWYEDIYTPFFVEKKADDGSALMASRRPRSRMSSFAKVKAPQTTRVFVIGGSVALLYDSVEQQSYGWTLRKVLEETFPGKAFEIVHCGMGGYDSYRENLIFDEILRYDPDVVVMLSGNNEITEVSGPPPTRWSTLLRKLPFKLPWRTDPGLTGGPKQTVLQIERFDRTLRAMVRRAKERSVTMVLCTMPRQLGLPPSGPLPRSGQFLEAWTLVQEGRWGEAETAFRLLNQREPGDAFGLYWLGRLLERRGDSAGAHREYALALREDYSRVPEINDRIRRIAAEEGAALADVENIFNNASPGPRNGNIVYDAMHWNHFTDPQVSLAIAQALGGASTPALKAGFSPKLLPALWRAFKSLKPTDEERTDIFRRKALGAIWDTALTEGSFNERSVGIFEDLYRDQPRWFKDIMNRKEDFSEHLGVWTESQRAGWDARWAFGLAHAGEAYRRAGLYADSVRYFDEARRLGCAWPIVQVHLALARKALGGKGTSLRQIIFEAYGGESDQTSRSSGPGDATGRPGKPVDPRYEQALAHQERKEFKAAVTVLNQMIKEQPSRAKLFNDRGVCRYLDGNTTAAIADFRRAIELNPGLLSAYSSLGTIYRMKKNIPEALKIYDLALARNPGSDSKPEMAEIRGARESILAGSKAAR